MVKKENKILWFTINLGASEAAQFGFFEDWRNFGNPQKLARFWNWGSHLFCATC